MTPKEKALELIGKFYYCGIDECDCKKCALISVDEIINTHLLSEKNTFGIHPVDYWQEVKQEIVLL